MRWVLGLCILLLIGGIVLVLENPFAEGLHRTARAQQTADDIITTGVVESVRYVQGGRQLADVRLTNSRGNGIVLRNCTTAYPVRVGNGVIIDFVEGDPRKGAFISGRTTPAETLTYDLGAFREGNFQTASRDKVFAQDTVLVLSERESILLLRLRLPIMNLTPPSGFTYPDTTIDPVYKAPQLTLTATITATFGNPNIAPITVLEDELVVDAQLSRTLLTNIALFTPDVSWGHRTVLTDAVLTDAVLTYVLTLRVPMTNWRVLVQDDDKSLRIVAPYNVPSITAQWAQSDTAEGTLTLLGSSTGG